MTDSNRFFIPGQTPITKISNGVWQLEDHLDGFDKNGFFKANTNRPGFKEIIETVEPIQIHTEYILPSWVKQNYPNYIFKFDADLMIRNNHLKNAIGYRCAEKSLLLDNFLCCFNRSLHCGRQWLVEALFERNLFDPKFCSKGFVIPQQKFDADSQNFEKQVIIHGVGESMDNSSNLIELSPLITSSFINLVSETVPESYVPFPTEKFLFPILNKRLWVAYAQPGYHKFLTEKLGFRLYDDLFDYSFDSILDPHKRLSALLDSIEQYSKLSKNAWHSIYKALEPAIEYNHQWATTGRFIARLKEINEVTKMRLLPNWHK